MIHCHQLSRSYTSGELHVPAVREVDLHIDDGEFVAITGPSGSGKSTLLNLIGSLDAPDSGAIVVAGLALQVASETEKTEFRRRDIGIVFQFFNLMPTMTVRENVVLPLALRGDALRSGRGRAEELLQLVGLESRAAHYPHQLSGGEMQRVALARALIHAPRLIIADEPTGNLDSVNRDLVIEVLRDIHRRGLATLVVVTHEEEMAEAASRRLEMRDGRVVSP